jgi:hypothetical protein
MWQQCDIEVSDRERGGKIERHSQTGKEEGKNSRERHTEEGDRK